MRSKAYVLLKKKDFRVSFKAFLNLIKLITLDSLSTIMIKISFVPLETQNNHACV